MLHLYGCKCYAVKRKLEVRRARSFEFEVVASQSSGTAGTSTASVASTPRSLKRFFMSAAKPDANPFNPMNASKNTYHWFAATAEERERYCRAHLFLNCSIPLCASLESSAYHVYFGVVLREAPVTVGCLACRLFCLHSCLMFPWDTDLNNSTT